MLERVDLEGPVAEGDFDPLTAARGDRSHFIGREGALGQDAKHLAAHIAGGAHDRDLVTHDHSPYLNSRLSLGIPLSPAGKPGYTAA
jgi:hypothetical protein